MKSKANKDIGKAVRIVQQLFCLEKYQRVDSTISLVFQVGNFNIRWGYSLTESNQLTPNLSSTEPKNLLQNVF